MKARNIHSTNTGVKQTWVNGLYVRKAVSSNDALISSNTSVVSKVALTVSKDYLSLMH